MNALDMARQAYSSSAPIRTQQSIEYDAFVNVTRRLKATANCTGITPELCRAVFDNRRLWITLASDVADSRNMLPESLRASIFYLAEFTEKHSREILRGGADVLALIDINSAIMQGLRQQAANR